MPLPELIDIRRLLYELGVESTPRCAFGGLLGRESLALRSVNHGLDISQSGSNLGRGELLPINGKLGLLTCRQLFHVAEEERIDGIDTVHRCVPSLSALLLEQPAAHLVDGLTVFGHNGGYGLDGRHLGRNPIVTP